MTYLFILNIYLSAAPGSETHSDCSFTFKGIGEGSSFTATGTQYTSCSHYFVCLFLLLYVPSQP